jgi:hypothetical protein
MAGVNRKLIQKIIKQHGLRGDAGEG